MEIHFVSFQDGKGDFTKYVLEGVVGSEKGCPGASHFKSNGSVKAAFPHPQEPSPPEMEFPAGRPAFR